jgi:hypothetical protein
MGVHVARTVQLHSYRRNFLAGKHQKRTPLERPKRRLEDNIKIDIKEILRVYVNSIQRIQNMVQCRVLANTVLYLRFCKIQAIS